MRGLRPLFPLLARRWQSRGALAPTWRVARALTAPADPPPPAPPAHFAVEELFHVLVDGAALEFVTAHKLMADWDVSWHHRLNPRPGRGASAYVFAFDTAEDAEAFVKAMRRRQDVRARVLDLAPQTERGATYEAAVASEYDAFSTPDADFADTLEDLVHELPKSAGWHEPTFEPVFTPPPTGVDCISKMAYEPTASEEEVHKRVQTYNILQSFREAETGRAAAQKDSSDPFEIGAYLDDLAAASSAPAAGAEADDDLDFLDRLSQAAHGGEAGLPLSPELHKVWAKGEAEWREEQLKAKIRKDTKLRDRIERLAKGRAKRRRNRPLEPKMPAEEYAEMILAERERVLGRRPTEWERDEVRRNAETVEMTKARLEQQRGRGEVLDTREAQELEQEALWGENKGPWMEHLVMVDQVQKVVPGGTVPRMRALTVAGNLNGAVGFGVGKAEDLQDAVEKSFRNAKRNLVIVDRYFGRGLYHDVYGKHNGCRVWIYARPIHTELRAGRITAAIMESAGIMDATVRIDGPMNPYSVVRATFNALAKHRSIVHHARIRGRRILTLYRQRELGIGG